MIRTKSTQSWAPAGSFPAGKLGQLYRSLLPVSALCVATVAWSQTAPGFRETGVQQAKPAATNPASAQYRFVSIEIPGATGLGPWGGGANAWGINNAGLVTGFYSDSSNASHGFVWRNGTVHTLDDPGSPNTSLWSVSNQGVAAAYYWDQTTTSAATYSFASGAWTMLPDIPGVSSNQAYGINKFGVVIGEARVNSASNPSAWIWDPSTQSYSYFAVPGAPQDSTYPDAINDKGQIVGTFADTSGVQHGFVKDGETYTTIDVPGANNTLAWGINNSGTIVGPWGNLSNWVEGYVRTSDGVFAVVDFPGALETFVVGINDRGDICGFWADPKTGLWTPFVGFKQ